LTFVDTLYIQLIGEKIWKQFYKSGGNSNAIRIPKVILDDLGIKTNDVLVLEKDNEKIIISKKSKEFLFKGRI